MEAKLLALTMREHLHKRTRQMEKQATRSESSRWHLQAPTRMSLVVLKRSQTAGPCRRRVSPYSSLFGGEGGGGRGVDPTGGDTGGVNRHRTVKGVPRLSLEVKVSS